MKIREVRLEGRRTLAESTDYRRPTRLRKDDAAKRINFGRKSVVGALIGPSGGQKRNNDSSREVGTKTRTFFSFLLQPSHFNSSPGHFPLQTIRIQLFINHLGAFIRSSAHPSYSAHLFYPSRLALCRVYPLYLSRVLSNFQRDCIFEDVDPSLALRYFCL
jgi:hypothetical protein